MNHLKVTFPYSLMFPALFIGTLAMVSYGVPASIWMQNIIIWIIGTLLGSLFIIKKNGKNLMNGNSKSAILIVVLLVLPFFFHGLEGIHRWVTIGPINIYIASILLPLLIIHLWKLALNHREVYIVGLSFITLVILLLHPDAGQLTAFACGAAILLWKHMNNRALKLLSITLTFALVALSWVFLDHLKPVPYVEDILFLVADMGNIWFITGIFSLLLLLTPFFYYAKKSILSLSLGVYFLTTMIVTFIGNFPMPIMGYGISPVIGYLISITFLNRNKVNLG